MSYAIKEMFLTLQGEGAHTGRRAVFIRFAGCNLWTGREQDRQKAPGACGRWCDTDFLKGTKMSAPQIVERVAELWGAFKDSPFVVLTGGEPGLQLDPPLLAALHKAGCFTAMETNGTVALRARPKWVTLSPKLGSNVVIKHCDELKVVLPGAAPDERGWTREALNDLGDRFLLALAYVQPQDPSVYGGVLGTQMREKNLALCTDFVMNNPRWRVSLQTHKLIGLP